MSPLSVSTTNLSTPAAVWTLKVLLSALTIVSSDTVRVPAIAVLPDAATTLNLLELMLRLLVISTTP